MNVALEEEEEHPPENLEENAATEEHEGFPTEPEEEYVPEANEPDPYDGLEYHPPQFDEEGVDPGPLVHAVFAKPDFLGFSKEPAPPVTCQTCGRSYDSRNKLHKHLQLSNHYKPAEQPSGRGHQGEPSKNVRASQP